MMMRSKRGSLEILFFVITVFLLALVTILGYTINSSIYDGLNESAVLDTEAMSIMKNSSDSYVSVTDTFFGIVFFGLIIFVIISGFYIRSHPIFFMIGVLSLILFSYFALILTGVYQEVTDAEEITSYAQAYNIIPFVMDNFLFFVVGIGAIMLIIIYGKRSDI